MSRHDTRRASKNSGRRKPSRFYVLQYNCVWSMTAFDFNRFLAQGATGGAWDLDDFGKRLTGPGKYGEWPGFRLEWIAGNGDAEKKLPARFREAVIIEPLDWDAERFTDAVSQFFKTRKVV